MSYYRSLIQIALPINPVWNTLLNSYNFDGDAVDNKSGANGTLINSPSFVAGVVNDCVTLNTVDQVVNLPDDSFKFTDSFSISFWYQFSGNGLQVPFSVLNSGGSQGFIIYHNAKKLSFQNYTGGVALDSGATLMTSDQMNHIVYTREWGVGDKLYCNGVLFASNSNVNNPTISGTSLPCVGAYRDGVNSYSYRLGNKVDILQSYDSCLTLLEIGELYNSGSGLQY